MIKMILGGYCRRMSFEYHTTSKTHKELARKAGWNDVDRMFRSRYSSQNELYVVGHSEKISRNGKIYPMRIDDMIEREAK